MDDLNNVIVSLRANLQPLLEGARAGLKQLDQLIKKTPIASVQVPVTVISYRSQVVEAVNKIRAEVARTSGKTIVPLRVGLVGEEEFARTVEAYMKRLMTTVGKKYAGSIMSLDPAVVEKNLNTALQAVTKLSGGPLTPIKLELATSWILPKEIVGPKQRAEFLAQVNGLIAQANRAFGSSLKPLSLGLAKDAEKFVPQVQAMLEQLSKIEAPILEALPDVRAEVAALAKAASLVATPLKALKESATAIMSSSSQGRLQENVAAGLIAHFNKNLASNLSEWKKAFPWPGGLKVKQELTAQASAERQRTGTLSPETIRAIVKWGFPPDKQGKPSDQMRAVEDLLNRFPQRFQAALTKAFELGSKGQIGQAMMQLTGGGLKGLGLATSSKLLGLGDPKTFAIIDSHIMRALGNILTSKGERYLPRLAGKAPGMEFTDPLKDAAAKARVYEQFVRTIEIFFKQAQKIPTLAKEFTQMADMESALFTRSIGGFISEKELKQQVATPYAGVKTVAQTKEFEAVQNLNVVYKQLEKELERLATLKKAPTAGELRAAELGLEAILTEYQQLFRVLTQIKGVDIAPAAQALQDLSTRIKGLGTLGEGILGAGLQGKVKQQDTLKNLAAFRREIEALQKQAALIKAPTAPFQLGQITGLGSKNVRQKLIEDLNRGFEELGRKGGMKIPPLAINVADTLKAFRPALEGIIRQVYEHYKVEIPADLKIDPSEINGLIAILNRQIAVQSKAAPITFVDKADIQRTREIIVDGLNSAVFEANKIFPNKFKPLSGALAKDRQKWNTEVHALLLQLVNAFNLSTKNLGSKFLAGAFSVEDVGTVTQEFNSALINILGSSAKQLPPLQIPIDAESLGQRVQGALRQAFNSPANKQAITNMYNMLFSSADRAAGMIQYARAFAGTNDPKRMSMAYRDAIEKIGTELRGRLEVLNKPEFKKTISALQEGMIRIDNKTAKARQTYEDFLEVLVKIEKEAKKLSHEAVITTVQWEKFIASYNKTNKKMFPKGASMLAGLETSMGPNLLVQVSGTNKSLSLLQGALVGGGRAAGVFGKGMLGAAGALLGFNRGITLAIRHLMTVAIRSVYAASSIAMFTAGFSLAGKQSLEAGGQFEVAMKVLQIVTRASAVDMGKFKERALDLGSSTMFAATEVAKAMSTMAKAGLSARDVYQGIDAVLTLATASEEDLTTTTEFAARVLNAFNIDGSKLAGVVDILAAAAAGSSVEIKDMRQAFAQSMSIAKLAGMSVEDLSIAIGLMGNRAIVGGRAGTGLRTMMMRLINPADESREIMKKLGFTLYDAAGQMKPLRTIIEQLKTSLQGYTIESRNAALAEIFSQEGARAAISLLDAGVTGWDNMADAVGRTGLAAQLANAQLDSLPGAFKRFQNTMEATLVRGGQPFSDLIKEILTGLRTLLLVVGSLPSVFFSFGFAIITVVSAFGAALSGTLFFTSVLLSTIAALGALAPFVVGIGVALGGLAAIVTGLATIWMTNFGNLRDRITEWAKGVIKDFLKWGANITASFATGIISALPNVVKAITAVINLISRFLRAFSPPEYGPLKDIEKWGKALMEAYLEGMSNADFKVMDDIVDAISKRVKQIAEVAGLVEEQVADKILKVRMDVLAAFKSMEGGGEVGASWQSVKEYIGDAADAIQGYIRALVDVHEATKKAQELENSLAAMRRANEAADEAGRAKERRDEEELESIRQRHALDDVTMRQRERAVQDEIDATRERHQAALEVFETKERGLSREAEDLQDRKDKMSQKRFDRRMKSIEREQKTLRRQREDLQLTQKKEEDALEKRLRGIQRENELKQEAQRAEEQIVQDRLEAIRRENQLINDKQKAEERILEVQLEGAREREKELKETAETYKTIVDAWTTMINGRKEDKEKEGGGPTLTPGDEDWGEFKPPDVEGLEGLGETLDVLKTKLAAFADQLVAPFKNPELLGAIEYLRGLLTELFAPGEQKASQEQIGKFISSGLGAGGVEIVEREGKKYARAMSDFGDLTTEMELPTEKFQEGVSAVQKLIAAVDKLGPAFEKFSKELPPLLDPLSKLADTVNKFWSGDGSESKETRLIGIFEALGHVLRFAVNVGLLFADTLRIIIAALKVVGEIATVVLIPLMWAIENVFLGMKVNTDALVDEMGLALGRAGKAFEDFINAIIDFFKQLWHTLTGGSIIPDLMRDILYWFSWPQKFVLEKWEEFKTDLGKLLDRLGNQIAQTIETTKNDFLEKVGELKSSTLDKIGELKDKLVDLIGEAKERALEKLGNLKDEGLIKLGELKTGIITKLTELATWLLNWTIQIPGAQFLIDRLKEAKSLIEFVRDHNPFGGDQPSAPPPPPVAESGGSQSAQGRSISALAFGAVIDSYRSVQDLVDQIDDIMHYIAEKSGDIANQAKAYASSARDALEALQDALSSMRELQFYSSPSRQSIAVFVADLAYILTTLNTQLIASVGQPVADAAKTFMASVSVAVSDLATAMEDLNTIRNFAAVPQANIDAFANSMARVILTLNYVLLTSVPQELATSVSKFTETLATSMGDLAEILDTLTKLQNFSGLSESLVNSFGDTLIRITLKLNEVAMRVQQLGAAAGTDILANIRHYTEALEGMPPFIKGVAEAVTALATITPLSDQQMELYMGTIHRLVLWLNRLAGRTEELNKLSGRDITKGIQDYTEGLASMPAFVKGAAEALVALQDVVPYSDAQFEQYMGTIHRMVLWLNRIAYRTQELSNQSGINIVQTISNYTSGLSTVPAFVKSAAEALVALQDVVPFSDAELELYMGTIHRLILWLNKIAVRTQQLSAGGDVISTIKTYTQGLSEAPEFIKKAAEALVALQDVVPYSDAELEQYMGTIHRMVLWLNTIAVRIQQLSAGGDILTTIRAYVQGLRGVPEFIKLMAEALASMSAFRSLAPETIAAFARNMIDLLLTLRQAATEGPSGAELLQLSTYSMHIRNIAKFVRGMVDTIVALKEFVPIGETTIRRFAADMLSLLIILKDASASGLNNAQLLAVSTYASHISAVASFVKGVVEALVAMKDYQALGPSTMSLFAKDMVQLLTVLSQVANMPNAVQNAIRLQEVIQPISTAFEGFTRITDAIKAVKDAGALGPRAIAQFYNAVTDLVTKGASIKISEGQLGAFDITGRALGALGGGFKAMAEAISEIKRMRVPDTQQMSDFFMITYQLLDGVAAIADLVYEAGPQAFTSAQVVFEALNSFIKTYVTAIHSLYMIQGYDITTMRTLLEQLLNLTAPLTSLFQSIAFTIKSAFEGVDLYPSGQRLIDELMLGIESKRADLNALLSNMIGPTFSAEMVGTGGTSVLVTGNNFYVRSEGDIGAIADAIAASVIDYGRLSP